MGKELRTYAWGVLVSPAERPTAGLPMLVLELTGSHGHCEP